MFPIGSPDEIVTIATFEVMFDGASAVAFLGILREKSMI